MSRVHTGCQPASEQPYAGTKRAHGSIAAAIAFERAGGDAAVITASAFPPVGAFAGTILAVCADHLHEHGMIVTAYFQLGLDPMQRVSGIVIPIIALHVDAGHGGVPALVQPEIRVAVL